MNSEQTAIMVVLTIAVAASTAGASVFTGFLSSADGGIWAADDWKPVSLGWTITALADGTWRYRYDLSVNRYDISHLIIEASLGFAESDIIWHNWSSVPSDIEVKEHYGPGNPGIPEPLFGIKFEDFSLDSTHWVVEFVTTRVPVWGDFYAVDGRGQGVVKYAYNSGFLLPDPTDPAASGSIDNHILRPDTTEDMIVVPEPGAALLVSVGFLPMIGFRLRMRTK